MVGRMTGGSEKRAVTDQREQALNRAELGQASSQCYMLAHSLLLRTTPRSHCYDGVILQVKKNVAERSRVSDSISSKLANGRTGIHVLKLLTNLKRLKRKLHVKWRIEIWCSYLPQQGVIAILLVRDLESGPCHCLGDWETAIARSCHKDLNNGMRSLGQNFSVWKERPQEGRCDKKT